MHDDHAHNHDAGHGHDDAHGHDSHGHGGQAAEGPLVIAWKGLGILALAIAAAAAVSWWAINNKPSPQAPATPVGTHFVLPASVG